MRKLKKFLFIIGLLYCGFFALLWTQRGALIYPFDPSSSPAPSQLSETSVTTIDQKSLVVWFAKPRLQKPVIFYFHGNAGNLASRTFRFQQFTKRGYGVIAMAYRGSSGSTGTPSEQSITSDARLIRNSIHTILGQTHTGPIIYYGESLGTGVAAKLASEIAPDGLILEAPYTSVATRAAEQFPMFPIQSLLDERWETLDYISSVTAPLLILHGTDDKVIPIEHGKRVFSAAASLDKTLNIIVGASHHQLWSVEGQTAIYKFINAQ
jgi:fermentation-respiration switch protein FrsA (DUF1100 family)